MKGLTVNNALRLASLALALAGLAGCMSTGRVTCERMPDGTVVCETHTRVPT